MASLRFYYIQLLKRGWSIAESPYPKKVHHLPEVLSQEEVARLIEAADTPFHRILLMTLYANSVSMPLTDDGTWQSSGVQPDRTQDLSHSWRRSPRVQLLTVTVAAPVAVVSLVSPEYVALIVVDPTASVFAGTIMVAAPALSVVTADV